MLARCWLVASGLLGLVVYVLILLPILVSVLNAMALDAVLELR